MIVYKIDFRERCNGINKNQLKGTLLFNLFRDYNGQIIDMRRLIATAQAYGFVVSEIIHNNNDSVYTIVSKNAPFSLNMSISRKPEYREKNEQIYKSTMEILKSMSNNAHVVNNNITNINQFQNTNQPNLQVIETTKCKGFKYLPSIKKLFKERPKLAIALCTLTAVTTIAAGGFVVKTAVDRIETQKYLDNHKQVEQQTTAPSEYNINGFIDETRKQYEMNNGIASEQQFQDNQDDQSYQRTR